MATLNVILTVSSSIASTAVTLSKYWTCAQPPSGSVQYSQVKTTSSAVKGVPSDQVTPGFSFQVIDFRSSEMPPFSTVGISEASQGTISPFWSKRTSGSSTSEELSTSLVPLDR